MDPNAIIFVNRSARQCKEMIQKAADGYKTFGTV